MCLFRNGPSQLPHNNVLIGITIAIYLIVNTALSRNARSLAQMLFQPETYVQMSFMSEFGTSLFALIVFAVLVYTLLRLFNRQERAYKTLFALIGTSLVFAALMLIGSAISSSSPLIWAFTFLALGIWSLLVSGYILGQALNLSTFIGVLFTIFIGVLQTIVMALVALIFGMPGGVAVPAPASLTT